MNKDSLGDRMKEYENVERRYFMRRQPLIIRLDGVHFHSYTKGFERPYYEPFRRAMEYTMLDLCENIMGCKLGYTQSDEITLLLTDDDDIGTQPWFGKNLQKIVSVAASMATYYFNKNVKEILELGPGAERWNMQPLQYAYDNKVACFDARAFLLPKEEVLNVFEWRQQDCTRNAIESAGQTYFSHGQLMNKSCNEIQEMLFQEKGINFNDYPDWYKRGTCAIKVPKSVPTPEGEYVTRMKWTLDYNIPIFHKEPAYIEGSVYHYGE